MHTAEARPHRAADGYVRAANPPRMSPVIVCGIGDLRTETAVVRFAAAMARRVDGRLVVVYAEPPPLISLEPQIAYAARHQDSRRDLRETAREIATLAADLGVAPSTRLRIGFGDLGQRLLAAARQKAAALVVIGADATARSSGGGSSVRRLLERAPCPVAVLPSAGAGHRGYAAGGEWGAGPIAAERPRHNGVAVDANEGGVMIGSIVCGVDGSPEARAALRFAAELAERLGVRLVASHVVQPPTPVPGMGPSARELAAVPVDALLAGGAALLERTLEEAELPEASRRVVLGFPADRLADLADEEAAELIIVGSRGRGSLRAALLGSVSAALIAVARCPVLVVPPHAEDRRGRRSGWPLSFRGSGHSSSPGKPVPKI
jgi:nucleotide-binding universal stress UspA family protein